MNNRKRSEKLFETSRLLYKEVENYIKSKNWNLAVRRAQEVVELVLKGLLAEMGLDYPKVHDVGLIFAQEIKKKGLKLEESYLNKILEISSYLSRKRAPAFYFEEEFNEAHAIKCAQSAQEVLSFGEDLLKLLRGEK